MIFIQKKTIIPFLLLILLGLTTGIDISATSIPPEDMAVRPKKLNSAFALKLESVLQKIKEKQNIIIDIRQNKEFDKFRIPGSLNIPLFAIKTKHFLKSKSLILVNEGYGYGQLEQACEDLAKSGFSVRYLYGGLAAWKEKGNQLDGDVFAQRDLNKISPLNFFAEKDYPNWIVADISASENSQAKKLIPQTVSIPYLNDEKKFVSAFKTIIAKYKDNPFVSVLIVDENGEQYSEMEELIRKAGFENVFFLEGGIENYRNFVHQRPAVGQTKHHSGNRVRRCSRCQ